MKLKRFILLCALFLSTVVSFAASKVTLNYDHAQLGVVLKEIARQSGYTFVYSDQVVNEKSSVTIHVKKVSIKQVMNLLASKEDFAYHIEGKKIYLTKKNTIRSSYKGRVSKGEKIKITGIVLDEMEEPVIGASVFIKGMQGGAITDVDGIFTVEAGLGATLLISYMGYKTTEIIVENDHVKVQLVSEQQTLDDVVVIGYGSVKRSDLTGSVSSLESSTITAASQTNAVDAMQGKIAGVNITRNAARPGGTYSITVRGVNSINNNQGPLWVIDGIPTSSDARDLNPADIEKIDVLKDASATAIYGSRGAGGVIIVTTKQGKKGRFSINYDGYYGMRVASHLPDMMNGEEYVQYRTDLYSKLGRSTDRSNAEFFTSSEWDIIDSGEYTDWIDLVLRTGQQYSNTITASGGDDKSTFSLSIGQLHEEGTIEDQDFNRYNVHLGVNRKFTDKWEAGGSLYFTHSKQDLGSYETLRSAYRLPPVATPYDETGNLTYHVYRNDAVSNPLLESSEDGEHRETKRYRMFGNIFLQFKPIEGLTLRSQFAPQFIYKREGVSIGPNAKNSTGLAANTNAEYHQTTNWGYVWDNQITYDKIFGKHKLMVTCIQSIQYDDWEYSDQKAKNFPYNSEWYNMDAVNLSDVTQSATNYEKKTLASFLGRIQYSFSDRYLLTVSGRYDGSSRLAEGNKWAFFPSAAFAWRMTEEKFLKSVEWLNNLKLRLSYGAIGNDAVSIYGTQSGVTQKSYDFGGTTVTSYYKSGLANKELTWEKTYELNLGLDFAFFNSRINGSLDLYQRDSKNLIMKRNIPITSGWSSVWDNIGWVRNRGVELMLNTVNMQHRNFSWTTNINFTYNKNEIVALYGEKSDDVGNKWFIGKPVRVNYDYVFDGIWQTNEADEAAKYGQTPGQVKVKDLNNDGVINASDKQILGQKDPKWIGGLTNTFTYRNFDLSIYIYTQQGAQLQDSFMSTLMTYDGNYKQVAVDYWTEQNPSNEWPQPGNKGKYYDSMRYVDVSFVRVGSITFGYNFGSSMKQKLGVNNLRLYFTTNNPFLFTSYKGFDPEWATQNTWGTVTGYTTYLFGVKLDF